MVVEGVEDLEMTTGAEIVGTPEEEEMIIEIIEGVVMREMITETDPP